MNIAVKSFNVVLISISFILAIVVAVKSQKPADEAKSSGDKNQKDIIFIHRTAIASSVLTAILLVLALGVFRFNNEKLYIANGILAFAVGITGGILGLLSMESYENNKSEFVKIGIAAGVLVFLAGLLVAYQVFWLKIN
jgi:hypothetical protein